MLFALGTRVRFRYTGETGTITAMLDDGMLQVRLDKDPDFEIPAFEEDLMRNTDAEPLLAGAKFVPQKEEKKPPPPPRREIKNQYVILKPKGLQLAFEPMPGRDGVVTRYKGWLINDTQHEFLVEFDLFAADRNVFFSDGKLAAMTALELGDLIYDDLNETPEVEIRIQRITTAGPDAPLDRFLKIRPKQFFNNLQTAPIINVLAHHFVLFDSFDPATAGKGSASDDLRQYTRQKIGDRRYSRSVSEPASTPYKANNVEEFATFIPEIDLHIQNLTNGYARLDKGEILRIQLLHCDRFLDKAIRLGVSHVFVIHGVGEGKLREALAQKLRAHPHVAKFKNEFHPKYGYGATEVILR